MGERMNMRTNGEESDIKTMSDTDNTMFTTMWKAAGTNDSTNLFTITEPHDYEGTG